MSDVAVSRTIWSISFLVAAGAHAALAIPWFWFDADDRIGAGGNDVSVIGVVLSRESRDVDHTILITPAPAGPVEDYEGNASPESEAMIEESHELEKAPQTEVPKKGHTCRRSDAKTQATHEATGDH